MINDGLLLKQDVLLLVLVEYISIVTLKVTLSGSQWQ